MSRDTMFAQLWNAPVEQGAPFSPELVAALPLAARQYLEHAIAPGTPLASAVRLQMSGEIRLKKTWYPFDADQVIRRNRGFVWRAKVSMKGLPVAGFDRWVDGDGVMYWKMLGIVPILKASGTDVSRSAMERMQVETIWIPSLLLDSSVTWTGHDAMHVKVKMNLKGQQTHFELSLDEQGRTCSLSMLRWGNPDDHGYSAIPFGGTVEEERTFGGFTIPSKLCIGWYFGTNRFETEGEFFRCTIKEAIYR